MHQNTSGFHFIFKFQSSFEFQVRSLKVKRIRLYSCIPIPHTWERPADSSHDVSIQKQKSKRKPTDTSTNRIHFAIGILFLKYFIKALGQSYSDNIRFRYTCIKNIRFNYAHLQHYTFKQIFLHLCILFTTKPYMTNRLYAICQYIV